MSKQVKIFKILACLIALTCCLSGCNNEPGKNLGTRSRLMKLISDYTEVVVDSSKVPGYWASQVSDKERFFLYTPDLSYKKGDVIRVEGTLGTTTAAVFDDETRVYQSVQVINLFVVWKAAISRPGADRQTEANKVLGK